jgi:hypothetical protein
MVTSTNGCFPNQGPLNSLQKCTTTSYTGREASVLARGEHRIVKVITMLDVYSFGVLALDVPENIDKFIKWKIQKARKKGGGAKESKD